jgi:hypothetical protein
MEIDPNTSNKAVKELLDKLVQDVPGRRWESLVTFSDGKGVTVIELNIYRRDGQEKAGRISFRLESGEVLNAHYPGFEGDYPETVVDLLLDVVNLEGKFAKMEG